MAATAPPPHGHRHGDDDYARRLNRRASSFRSSVAEADRCRRSMASPTDAIRRRRSRASPPSPNRRPRCGTRPSDDNSFMPGGADDHPPRRSRVSDGEESDRRRRRARVSDDEREDGRRQMRSGVSDDQRDSRRVKLCRRIPSPERGLCPDDHRVDRWRRQDDCRRMEDNHGKCSTSLERREQMTREVKGDASPEYQRQHEWSPEHQRHYWDALEKCMEYHKQNKATLEYQRHSWDALDKNISELLNKVNASNINDILSELFAQNLIRGRGLFCQSCIKAQMASPLFTDVFAALVAVVNTKFPEIGHLLLVRVVLHLKRAFKRNDMVQLLAATKFVAHLVNQVVARELVALELLEVLLVNRTDDSVKVAVIFVKECGAMLQLLSPQRLHAIFERFRRILHEGEIGKHVQLLIKGLFAIRKTNFKGFPPIRPELDLVDQENKFTHDISLEDELDPETNLNLFRVNPNFIEYEKACENIKKSMLGPECCKDEQMETSNEYETGFLTLKRILRSTVMASAYFEEAGLVKIEVKPGQEMELCATILECCFEDRIYRRYFGLLAQRYCMMRKVYQENFEKCFMEQYSMAHQLETCKLCIVAKFFAHLLETDTLPWHVLACIRLTEEQASSTRIFVKVLFQELLKHLGIQRLKEKLNNPDVQGFFGSVFPEDHPRNLRFAISFFTAIGLGVITEKFREKLPQPASSGSQSSSGYESSSGSE